MPRQLPLFSMAVFSVERARQNGLQFLKEFKPDGTTASTYVNACR